MRRSLLLAIVAVLAVGTGWTDSSLAHAHTWPANRNCGSVPRIAPNHVRASKHVRCTVARRMMRKLLGGSKACYGNGYTSHPKCHLNGYRCRAQFGNHSGKGRCVKGRGLVV